MIRIAMVTPFPEQAELVKGGVEGVAVCLTGALDKLGEYQMDIVSPASIILGNAEQQRNQNVHWVSRSRLPGFLDYWTILRKRLHKRLEQLNPDVTHFQGLAGWTIGYKKPYVLTIHGVLERDAQYSTKVFPGFRSAVYGQVERKGRGQASDIIVISPYLSSELGGQIRGRQWHIENPIQNLWFDIERSVYDPRVLYIGRISKRKNIDGLIRAFALVSEKIPNAQLVLAGTADDRIYEQQIKELVTQHQLDRQVVMLGNVDRNSLRVEMSRASCLVLVSHQETAPLVIEEAMASGVPVVASNLCGHPFLIKHGVNGFLVDQLNTTDISNRIIWLLQHKEENLLIGASARSEAHLRFRADVVATKTGEIYKSLARVLRCKRVRSNSIVDS